MKTYIIRLSDSELSCNLAKDAFRDAARFNYNPEYFEAIKGSDAESYLKLLHLEFSEDIPLQEQTPGTKGCFASHFTLWQAVANADKVSVILEHDGLPVRDVAPIISLVDDVCHLDRHLPFNTFDDATHQVTYTRLIQDGSEEGVSEYPPTTFYDSKNKTGSTFRGAYAYIITPKGAQKLINFCRTQGAMPSDKVLCENAVHIQRANVTYARMHPFFKTLAYQHAFSTRFGDNQTKLQLDKS